MKTCLLICAIILCYGTLAQELTPAENDANHWNPSVSPDGQKVVFAGIVEDNYQLFIYDFTSAISRQITNDKSNSWRPSWSNDGKFIAYSSDATGNYQIYLIKPDGSDKIQITTGNGDKQRMAWSPDSKRLVFDSDEDGDFDLYIIDLSSLAISKLTNHAGFEGYPHWNKFGQLTFNADIHQPDGKSSSREIYILNSNNELVRLTFNDAFDQAPKWSPDGKWIAYFSTVDGNAEIYKINVNTKENIRLTNNNEWDFMPNWTPDGNHIVFDSRRDGRRGIFKMSAEGAEQRKLTNLVLSDFINRADNDVIQAISQFNQSRATAPGHRFYLEPELYALVDKFIATGQLSDAFVLLNFHLHEMGYDPKTLVNSADYYNTMGCSTLALLMYKHALKINHNERISEKIKTLSK